MHRFFAAHADLCAPSVTLTDPAEIHHLVHVLRLKPGAGITLFDGKGEEAAGVIQALGKTTVTVRIEKTSVRPAQERAVVLACAIPKKAKFEWIVEKCTELGVNEIIPLITERTEVRYGPELARRKLARFHTIAVNAAKQCGRTDIPDIHPLTDFRGFVATLDITATAFLPCLCGERLPLVKQLLCLAPKGRIVILIGPEGDFSPAEVALARQKGCVPVSLGDDVLKVDTAAIATVALARSLTSRL